MLRKRNGTPIAQSKLIFLHNKQYPEHEPLTNHFRFRTGSTTLVSHSVQQTSSNIHNSNQPLHPDLLTNLSNEELSPNEIQLLSLGPKFSVSSFPRDKQNLIMELKNGFQRLVHSIRWYCQDASLFNRDQFKPQVFVPSKKEISLPRLIPEVERIVQQVKTGYSSVLQKIERMKLYSNLSPHEWRALKNLRTRNLVFDISDKGGDFCIIDSDTYRRVMIKELTQTGKFRRIAKVPIVKIEERLNSVWRSLCRQFSVDKRIEQHHLSKNSNFAQVRGLVKTHKLSDSNKEIKVRLVINTVNTPGFSLAWFLQQSIAVAVREFITNTSSNQVIQEIKNMSREVFLENSYAFSLDVIEMFHNTPRGESIQCLVDILSEKSFSLLNIPPREIGLLIDVILRSNQFVFENDLYIQFKGLPIGNRLSGLLADVFISHVKKVAMSPYQGVPCFRYVDDFLVFGRNEDQADEIKNAFNAVHNSVQFEIEKPENDGLIHFLDFSIKIINGNPHFVFYQKPSRKPMFVHARSALPKSTFKYFIQNEKTRIHDRCSDENERKICLNRFNQTLSFRGHKSINLKPFKHQRDLHGPRFFLNIPFINNKTNNLIRSTLRHLGLRISIIHKSNTLNSLIKRRSVSSQNVCQQCRMVGCDTTHVVYKMSCDQCNQFYIGSTIRKIHFRVREHLHSRSSMVNQHRCQSTWTTKILYISHHVQRLRYMEALCIKEQRPLINTQENLFQKHILF